MTPISFAFILMAAMVWLVVASVLYVKALAVIELANKWPTLTLLLSLVWPGVLLWVLIEGMLEKLRGEEKQ